MSCLSLGLDSNSEMSLHTPGWQEVGPDVDGLVGHLEAAEDAVQRRALWMAVTGDDAVLPEHLNTKQTFREVHFVFSP